MLLRPMLLQAARRSGLKVTVQERTHLGNAYGAGIVAIFHHGDPEDAAEGIQDFWTRSHMAFFEGDFRKIAVSSARAALVCLERDGVLRPEVPERW